MNDNDEATKQKKHSCGVPTGNAGEYFVMDELLRRGLDAQLSDHDTKGYDILVERTEVPILRKVQVKTVRQAPLVCWSLRFQG